MDYHLLQVIAVITTLTRRGTCIKNTPCDKMENLNSQGQLISKWKKINVLYFQQAYLLYWLRE